MRRLAVITSVAAAFFLGATSAWAKQEAPAQKHLKNLRFLLGDWELTGEMHWAGQQPEPFEYERRFRWTMDRTFIQDQHHGSKERKERNPAQIDD